MDAGVGELHLRLRTAGVNYAKVGRLIDKLGHQRGLADTGFTTDDQDAAVTFPRAAEQPGQHLLLTTPAEKVFGPSMSGHGSHPDMHGQTQGTYWAAGGRCVPTTIAPRSHPLTPGLEDPGVYPGLTARCPVLHSTHRTRPGQPEPPNSGQPADEWWLAVMTRAVKLGTVLDNTNELPLVKRFYSTDERL